MNVMNAHVDAGDGVTRLWWYCCRYYYPDQVCQPLSACPPFPLSNINLMLVVISNVSILNPGPRQLKVLYNNVQGLVRTGHLDSDSPPLDMTKVGEIRGFIYMHKYDIIILNETWLKPKISSNCIFPRNFKIYRIDRSEHSHPHDPTNPKKFRRNGGGVLIAHREDLDVSSFRFSKVSVRAELLSIVLSFPSGKKLCISTMYRVGNLGSANFESFKEHFDSLFQSRKFCMHVMIGDFNFSGVNWPEAQPRSGVEELFLSYLMGDLGHSQYINSPTHCKGNTLDLLFSNDPRCVSNIDIHDQHELCLSDHFAISFNINFDVKRTTIVRRKIKCYDLANWVGFNADLSFIKWKMVLSGDIHSNWDTFHSLIDDLSETHIPTKITKPSLVPLGRDMEWEHARKRKENLRQRANRTGSESDLSNFKAARASLKRLEDAKLRGSLDMDNRDSVSKRFWGQVKVNSKTTRIPPIVNNGEVFRSSGEEQANLFNEYFASNFSAASDYNVLPNITESNFESEFSASEIYDVLSKLNSRKAAGPDDIHSVIYKECAGSLAYPLSILYNQAYNSVALPNIWKAANVVPVHKSGDTKDVRNYRPISLTCIIMKILERLMYNRLLSICISKLDSRQHGFLPGRSCLTQLVLFLDDLISNDNERVATDIIYFDFSKAFDSVNHDLILSKIRNRFGVDGKLLGLIRVYLMGRTQRVVVGGCFSSFLSVLSGVPQGSLLGPLLFVMFIDDITECLVGNTKLLLYADDLKVWSKVACLQEHLDLQLTVDYLHSWAVTNKMVFHPGKCKVVSTRVYTQADYWAATWSQLPFYLNSYKLAGVVLDNVDVQRDLGIYVCRDLDWRYHCQYILGKFTDRFNLLRRTMYMIVNPHQKRTLYVTLVRSFLEHCSPIWTPHQVGVLNDLEAAQKRCIKWVYGVSPRDSWSEREYYDKLVTLRILPIREQFYFNDMKLFFKIVHGLAPNGLPDYLCIVQPTDCPYRSRLKKDIVDGMDITTIRCTIESCTSKFRNGFFYRSVDLWNSIPYEIRQAVTYSSFCLRLKCHIFNSLSDYN